MSYTYDLASRLLGVANLSPTGSTLSSFAYTLDAVGNRLSVVEATGERVTWTYDNTYQLVNEQRSGSNSYNITYTYGPRGNRQVLINGGVRTTSSYNAANELTASQTVSGVTTYTYDPAGNLLTSQSPTNQLTTNTWDVENRLTRVALPSGIVDTFTYNGDGLRVQKQDSTGTTNHIWDGKNILLETDGSNIIQVLYTLEPATYGNLISQSRSAVESLYLFDAMGSTSILTTSTGMLANQYFYDAFGNILPGSTETVTNPFQYIGKLGYYADTELGTYYLRARFFNSGTGRFVNRDPIGVRGGSNAIFMRGKTLSVSSILAA